MPAQMVKKKNWATGDDRLACGQCGWDLKGDDRGIAGIWQGKMAHAEVHWGVELSVHLD